MTYVVTDGPVCDAGCCLWGYDPELRPPWSSSVESVEPMFRLKRESDEPGMSMRHKPSDYQKRAHKLRLRGDGPPIYL